MLLGRFSPPYISVIVPCGVAVWFIWWLVGYWDEAVTPYAPFGEPTLWNVVVFTMQAGVLAAYLIGPVVGAWLLALQARVRKP